MYEKFSGYVEDEEARMKKTLTKLSYNIDALNTLTLLTGKGRLDKVRFPTCFSCSHQLAPVSASL